MAPAIDTAILEKLRTVGTGAAEIRAAQQLLQSVRDSHPEAQATADRFLVTEMARLRDGLGKALANLQAVRDLHERLTAPPWHPATYLGPVSGGPQALVHCAGSRRIVQLADDLMNAPLQRGDEVLLSHDLNVALRRADLPPSVVGETARFRRYAADGRLVVESHQSEFVAQAAAGFVTTDLQEGDAVRWDRQTCLVYEKLDQVPSQRYFVSEIPDVRPEQVGGQRAALQTLLNALTTILVEPEKAQRYGLTGRQSVLLVGPAGCGKTLMSRVVASMITRLSGVRCHFAVVKPAEWEDPFVGVTQQNIRNCFAAVREAAGERDFAVLFLDEVEAVARIRGDALGQHNDKFLAALLAEMDGFTSRGRTAIIAATNRKDMLDPAIAERLSDVQIRVARPDLRGAREILEIHLGDALPYSPNGELSRHTRQAIIDRAVSRIYDPNGGSTLCTLRFRDGKTRPVAARELISGRVLEQICRAARQAAFLRDVREGEAGVRVEDIDEAVHASLGNLATTLTPRNVRTYLDDLPQESDVIAVEPVGRRSGPRSRYQNRVTD